MSSSPAMANKAQFSLAVLRGLRLSLTARFYVGVLSGAWANHDEIHDDIPTGSPILSATYKPDHGEWANEIGKMCGLKKGGENSPAEVAIRRANAERIARTDQTVRRLAGAAPILSAIEEAKGGER